MMVNVKHAASECVRHRYAPSLKFSRKGQVRRVQPNAKRHPPPSLRLSHALKKWRHRMGPDTIPNA